MPTRTESSIAMQLGLSGGSEWALVPARRSHMSRLFCEWSTAVEKSVDSPAGQASNEASKLSWSNLGKTECTEPKGF